MGCSQLIALVIAGLFGGAVLAVLRGLLGWDMPWAATIAILGGCLVFIVTTRTVKTI